MRSAALFTLWLLLLLLGFVSAHDDDNRNVEFTNTNPMMEDTGYYSEHGADLDATIVQNVLEAFGINDTEFRPGQLMCPPTNLTGMYKEKTITIGMAGCLIDPLISQYTSQQRKLLRMHHDASEVNCSDTAGLAGYLPPIAGTVVEITKSHYLHGHLFCVSEESAYTV